MVARCRSTCRETVSSRHTGLSDALRIAGARAKRPIADIVKAVLSGELPAGIGRPGLKGLSSLTFESLELRSWLKSRRKVDQLSIPVVARKLRINQEFAYQLVNHGLLHSKTGINGVRVVQESDLRRFRRRYLIHARLAKRTNLSNSELNQRLTSKGYRRVDSDWPKKLRQRVYQKPLY